MNDAATPLPDDAERSLVEATDDENASPLGFLENAAAARRQHGPPPTYRLFSIGAIVWAAVLGGLPGMGSLLAFNFLRAHRYVAALAVLAVGAAIIFGLSYFGGRGIGGGVVLAVLLGLVATDALQGKLLEDHRRRQGQMFYYPWGIIVGGVWAAALIALLVIPHVTRPLMIDYDDAGIHAPDDFNGLWEVYWPNKQLKFRANYVNGQEHGEVTCWWENGVVAQTGLSEHGVCKGVWADYWESGIKFKETEYQDGDNFVVRWFSPDGKITDIDLWKDGEELPDITE